VRQAVSAQALMDAEDPRRVREVITPEGLPLRFVVAGLGERVAAFAIDMGILIALVVALLIGAGVGSLAVGGELGSVTVYLGVFLLRNFYFLGFELRWSGRTPGKRAVGIRVIDAAGGPLEAGALIARNLSRELEIWVPLGLLFTHDVLFPGVSLMVTLLALVWLAVLLLLPCFNADRKRVGDLIGGTLVVLAPRGRLERDVAERPVGASAQAQAPSAFSFTKKQLSHYGIYELQVLEDLLRRPGGPSRDAAAAVCYKIKVKIGWPVDAWEVPDRIFLRDFYAAQRAELERNMQFGVRKEHKFDGAE